MSVALPMTKKEKEAMVVPIWGVKVREREELNVTLLKIK